MVSTRVVAASLGLSERTIRLYAAAGRIPFTTTPGGHRRFDLDAVRQALYGRTTGATPTMASLRAVRSEINAASRRHGARRVRVFGSVASGTAEADSDIDLLVQLDNGRTYADLEDLQHELQDLLGRRVDIVTEGACHGRLADVPRLAVRL